MPHFEWTYSKFLYELEGCSAYVFEYHVGKNVKMFRAVPSREAAAKGMFGKSCKTLAEAKDYIETAVCLGLESIE